MTYSYDQHADAVIQTYGLKQKSGKEYGDKPCPNCGGTDRFWINEYKGNLTHHCRQECDFLERQAALQRDGALPIDADPTLNEEHRKSEPRQQTRHTQPTPPTLAGDTAADTAGASRSRAALTYVELPLAYLQWRRPTWVENTADLADL